METQYAKVNVPGYGIKEFPVENGIPPTQAQVKEWMQYNPEAVAKWEKVDSNIITKEAIDEVAKYAGPIDRAQLYMGMFFNNTGENVGNAYKYAKENPGKVAKNAATGGAKIGLEAGGQAIGNVVGTAFGGVGMVPLGAAGAGIGNLIGQAIDDDPFSWGDFTAAVIMGAVPGTSLANASARQLAFKGSQYALAGVAADAARKQIDQGRAITAPEALSSAVFGYGSAYLGKALDKARNAPTVAAAKMEMRMGFEEESRKMGRELGFVLPPTEVNNSPLNQKIQSLSGIIDPAKDAIRRNQPFLEAALERDIGIGVELKFDGDDVFSTAAGAMKGRESGTATRMASSGGAGPSAEFRKTLPPGVDKFETTGTASRMPRAGRIDAPSAPGSFPAGPRRLGEGLPQIESGQLRLGNGGGSQLARIDTPDLPVVTGDAPIDFFGDIGSGGFRRAERSVGGSTADTRYDQSSFKQSVNMNGGGSGNEGALGPVINGPTPGMRNVGSSSAANTPIGGTSQRTNMGGATGSYTPDFGRNNVINPDTLPFHIARFTKSYKEAGEVSDAAAVALSDWRKANYNARQSWWEYRQPQGGSPAAQEQARAFEAQADEAFERLSKEAALGGRGDLAKAGKDGVSKLESDRRMLARLGVIELAMNRGNGYKDADVLGRLLDAGAPLDGNLRKAARFNLAYGRYLKDKATTTAPGVNRFGAEMAQIPMALAGAGAAWGSGGNPMQVLGSAAGAAALVPAMRAMTPSLNNGARRFMFSEGFQNSLRPDYGPTRMDTPAAMARYMAASAGQTEPVQAPLNDYLRR